VLDPFPAILVLGASPPPDHFSFHIPTQPVGLGLAVWTLHQSLSSLLDVPLIDVQLLTFCEILGTLWISHDSSGGAQIIPVAII
jgi:hypothetical protein